MKDCVCVLGVSVPFSDMEVLTGDSIQKGLDEFNSHKERVFKENRKREYDNMVACTTTRSKLDKWGFWCFDYCPTCGKSIEWGKL